jgi:ribosome-associated toxin RatA of RatAB toxin-antitoxin module
VESVIGIDVAATPRKVFELASDLRRWPERLPHYRRVTIRRQAGDRLLAQMVAVRGFGPLPIPVSWRAEYWPEPGDPEDLRLRFRHIRGISRGMDVTWHITPRARGARVEIEHRFTRPLPLLGAEALPRLLDRFFVRPIAGRTLQRFKELAEGAQAR